MVSGCLVCVGEHILAFFLFAFPPSLLSRISLRVLARVLIMLYIVCLMEPHLNSLFTRVSNIIGNIVDRII